MGDGTNFEIPRKPLDVELRPLATADQRTRQQTAIVGWTRAVSDLAVSASFYQRWSRTQLFPAAGPLTAVAESRSRAGDDRRKGRRDAASRDVMHSRWAWTSSRFGPGKTSLYNYNGFLALTHLLALPHIHFPLDDIRFSGRETGNQVSAYVQDGIQIGDRVTADVGVPPRSVRSCGVGDAPEPAGQRRASGRPRGGRARVVQPLLRAASHRRRVVEQRGPDGADRGDRSSAASAASPRPKTSSSWACRARRARCGSR